MKKTLLTLLVAAFGFYGFAQSNGGTESGKEKKGKRSHADRCSPFYIAVSTGLNNNVGVAGVILDLPVTSNFDVEAGAGLSTWGNKVYGGVKYFLEPCHLGWAFGAGITHNTGLTAFQDNLATTGGTEPVTLDLNQQTNLLFAAYKYWQMGRGRNRFYLELGYSIRLTGGDLFDYDPSNNSDPLTDNSSNTIKLLSPGGIIVGVGFTFGLK